MAEKITGPEYLIDTTSLYDSFKAHIDISNNDKIFFSGGFGTGKTTFLSEFFKKYNDEYDLYHLFPLNYQIKTNEDIVELIKYDLFVTLLKKYPDTFEENDVDGFSNNILLWREFISSRYTVNDVLQTTVSYLEDGLEICDSILQTNFSKLGRPLTDILKLDKQFQEFKSEYKKGEFSEVEVFLNSVETKETDVLSYLLSRKISKHRSGKKSVLILDDLDRIDPAHIFRILNIFSAFHEKDESNKFGFDKIIVVGDISNIQHIFHHFYGKDTDFWGYIDKFYSHKIYTFNFAEILSSEIVKLIKCLGNKGGEVLEGFENDNYFIHGVMHHILFEAAFVEEAPRLRQLLKLNRFSSVIREESNYREKLTSRGRHEEMLYAIHFVIRVLIQVYRTPNQLCKLLNLLKTSKKRDNIRDSFYLYYSKPLLFNVMGVEPRSGLEVWKSYSLRTEILEDGMKWDDDSKNKNERELFFELLISTIEGGLYLP